MAISHVSRRGKRAKLLRMETSGVNGVVEITQVTYSVTSCLVGLPVGKPSRQEADNIETARVNSLKAPDLVFIPLTSVLFLPSLSPICLFFSYFHSRIFHLFVIYISLLCFSAAPLCYGNSFFLSH
ncbi:hypothetical protein E2C01_099986 [Portunus trituberculatus]|uniref:Uncharacterized protein n=1 Tax=Portunus trituberculatus TaxID=210409 RepID=A0A5B7KCC1_PORTR|nr:hypothetical protein [Portunus trituberculatus]